jgi:hypothetical protein
MKPLLNNLFREIALLPGILVFVPGVVTAGIAGAKVMLRWADDGGYTSGGTP